MKIKLNQNFSNLKESYLFSDIAKRVNVYREQNPQAEIIRLGIGDVTLPLSDTVVKAFSNAVAEMGVKETFRGYPPEYGYDFLKQAIANHYKTRKVDLELNEIFVSDGAKSDSGNITDILGNNEILIPDPVYPVYFDSNTMAGNKINLAKGNIQNKFLPSPDGVAEKPYVIYICSPNNPTGAVYSSEGLKQWVDFALKTGSLIIFDSAYEMFISGDEPHSIFEIEGAKECALEICSLSKTAGFTGTRLGWTVIPSSVKVGNTPLAKIWARRQATKFNGVCYPVQRAAEAALSAEGMQKCREVIAYYMENASILASFFKSKQIFFTGGIASPYIWLKCPDNMGSWEFFDLLLNKIQVVGTPGEGFGECGKGYFRLTAFGSRENTIKAVERLKTLL